MSVGQKLCRDKQMQKETIQTSPMKFQKLTPNFSVHDVSASVKYYQEVLGFKLEMAVQEGLTTIEDSIADGHKYAYAMVSRDDVYIMFLQSDSFKKDIPELSNTPQGASVLFYIDVENIDDVYGKIKTQAEITKKLETAWYGMREFSIKDCNGYILGFAEKE